MATNALERAHDFMQTDARDVERLVFNHVFREEFDHAADLDAIATALEGFQNADGGYGHGLEPDLHTYCLQPLDVITHGRSPFRHVIADLVDASVDYQREQQDDDGGWSPTWSWFGNFPDDWQSAKVEWRGVVTLQTAIKLHSFDAFA